MAFILKPRVKETAAAPGTGQITLGGAVTGFQAFSAVCSNGDTPSYTINDTSGNWEVGIGTYVSSGNKLSRTTVLGSSNSGSAVNFSGSITMWGDLLAQAAQCVPLAAFLVNMTGDQTNFNGTGATKAIPFNQAQQNVGGYFNLSTNLFKAPCAGILSGMLGIQMYASGPWDLIRCALDGSVQGTVYLESGLTPNSTINNINMFRPYSILLAASETVQANDASINAAVTTTTTMYAGTAWSGVFVPV
jgi:hypothetical protein